MIITTNESKRREEKRKDCKSVCDSSEKIERSAANDRYLEGKSGGGRDKEGFIVLETRISAVRSLFYSRDELWRVN